MAAYCSRRRLRPAIDDCTDECPATITFIKTKYTIGNSAFRPPPISALPDINRLSHRAFRQSRAEYHLSISLHLDKKKCFLKCVRIFAPPCKSIRYILSCSSGRHQYFTLDEEGSPVLLVTAKSQPLTCILYRSIL